MENSSIMKGEESVSRVMVVTEQTTGESIVMHDVWKTLQDNWKIKYQKIFITAGAIFKMRTQELREEDWVMTY